jgi:hypothetical protein
MTAGVRSILKLILPAAWLGEQMQLAELFTWLAWELTTLPSHPLPFQCFFRPRSLRSSFFDSRREPFGGLIIYVSGLCILVAAQSHCNEHLTRRYHSQVYTSVLSIYPFCFRYMQKFIVS